MTGPSLRETFAGSTPGGAQLPTTDVTGILGVLPDRVARASKTFFVAPITALAVAAGLVGVGQFRADSSHDFVAYFGTFTVRNAATGAIIVDPNILVSLTDEQNRSFSPRGAAGLTELRNIAGASANTPGILPVPILVAAGVGLNVEFTNQEAVAVNIRLALIGFLAGNVA